MLRSAASKVMWVGRATVFLIGLAVILALIFGVASTALGANGGNFILGKKNVASAISTLVKQGPGPALSLIVRSGQPPLKVNSTGRVPRLNADMVDGKHSTEIGINALERVSAFGANNSNSPKSVSVSCPPGKIVVGTGFNIGGGSSGTFPSALTNVVVDEVLPDATSVFVEAYEEEPTNTTWVVGATAICAKAP